MFSTIHQPIIPVASSGATNLSGRGSTITIQQM